MKRILFIGGGSIGHLAPCVAVWRAVQKMNPNAEAFLLCSERREEAEFLSREHLAFEHLPLLRHSILFPFQFLRARRKAKKIIKRFRPDVIFNKGGSLSIAPCIVAVQRKIPIVLHESDAVMGRANRFLSRYADVVCLGFPKEHSQFSILNSQFTGNPIRPEVTQGSREEGLRITGLSGTRPIVLILGGSQGAQAINEFIWNNLDEILELCDVIHVTGRGKVPGSGFRVPGSEYSTRNKEQGTRTIPGGYWSIEFAHEQLPHLYAIATIAVSRGGAGSISELAANGIATIVIPLEGLAQNHQVENAKQAAASGGCIHMPQDTMQQELVPEIRSLIEDPGARKEIAEKFRAFSKLDAAQNIASILLSAKI